MMNLTDRIALVTGASRGLGRALALALGSAGAQVIAVARTVGGLEELDDAIRAAGGRNAVLVPLDICDDDGLARLGGAIHERWGRLDVWAHTAVQAPMLSPVEHLEGKDFDTALNVNVRAVQRLIRVLDPLLRRSQAGRVVFVDDPMAPDAFNAGYTATKATQRLLAVAWGLAMARSAPARVLHARAPAMRTGLRTKWFPGEDREALVPPADVAAAIIAALVAGRAGTVDLCAEANAASRTANEAS